MQRTFASLVNSYLQSDWPKLRSDLSEPATAEFSDSKPDDRRQPVFARLAMTETTTSSTMRVNPMSAAFSVSRWVPPMAGITLWA